MKNKQTTMTDLLKAALTQNTTTKQILDDINTLMRLKVMHKNNTGVMLDLNESLDCNDLIFDFYQLINEEKEQTNG